MTQGARGRQLIISLVAGSSLGEKGEKNRRFFPYLTPFFAPPPPPPLLQLRSLVPDYLMTDILEVLSNFRVNRD